MKLFNTYEEAVISNGGTSGICKNEITGEFLHLVEELTGMWADWKECNPADYLETLEDFLSSGKELVRDDLVTNLSGGVDKVFSVDVMNTPDCVDYRLFVLKSAAYDTDTPDEKEAFDAMTYAAPQQVDWRNGDHCIFGAGDRSGIYVTYDAYNEGYVIYSGGEYHYVLGGDFRKPETPSEREEREREESARELYLLSNKVMAGTHMINHYNFQESKDVWLAIVDETSYRKERKQ